MSSQASELLKLSKVSWDLPSVFSVIVFGEEPGWCDDWAKWRQPLLLEYKKAMLGEVYGAVSLIVIGNIDSSKRGAYVDMIRDIQVSLPNTHVAVPAQLRDHIGQSATTLWYKGSESPWSAMYFAQNGFAAVVEDGDLLKPSVVIDSLVARRTHIRDTLQHDYNVMAWQCENGWGMFHRLKHEVQQPPSHVPLLLSVNSTSAIGHTNLFTVLGAHAAGKPHYTLNVVRFSELVQVVQHLSRDNNTTDEYEVLDDHVFHGSDNRSIVNVLVMDDVAGDMQRVLDYTQHAILYRWYVLHEKELATSLEPLLVRHIVSLEKFPTPHK